MPSAYETNLVTALIECRQQLLRRTPATYMLHKQPASLRDDVDMLEMIRVWVVSERFPHAALTMCSGSAFFRKMIHMLAKPELFQAAIPTLYDF